MKFLKLIPLLFILTLFNSNSVAAETRDCSEINSKSITGLYDKLRCKAGKPPREKKSIGEKFKGWFKPKN